MFSYDSKLHMNVLITRPALKASLLFCHFCLAAVLANLKTQLALAGLALHSG